MKKIYLSLIVILTLASCTQTSDDQVKTVDRNGSVDAVVSIKHLPDPDSRDVLTVERKIWVHGQLNADITTEDTIPGLGTAVDTAENSNGDDTTVVLPKNYQIFLTVK